MIATKVHMFAKNASYDKILTNELSKIDSFIIQSDEMTQFPNNNGTLQ